MSVLLLLLLSRLILLAHGDLHHLVREAIQNVEYREGSTKHGQQSRDQFVERLAGSHTSQIEQQEQQANRFRNSFCFLFFVFSITERLRQSNDSL